MANLNEQIAGIWDEWESQTPADANNPDDFIDWAVENGKMVPRPEDIRKIFRRQVSTALRQVYRTDDEGTTYRAKQCVTIVEEGKQLTLWFDVDKKGTPRLRQRAAKQRREGIANDVFRAMSDVAHMNYAFPDDEEIQFELDFTEDYEERKALERYEREQKEAS